MIQAGLSPETVVIAFANIGAVVYLVRSVVGRVDKHNEILPEVVQTLKNISENQREISRAQRDLYESRNDHDRRLTEIETTHRLNGCGVPKANP
jgi:predicted transcriptional regulator